MIPVFCFVYEHSYLASSAPARSSAVAQHPKVASTDALLMGLNILLAPAFYAFVQAQIFFVGITHMQSKRNELSLYTECFGKEVI